MVKSSELLLVSPSSVNIASDEGFLKNGDDPVLNIVSSGHSMQVFVNGQPSGKQTNVSVQLCKNKGVF